MSAQKDAYPTHTVRWEHRNDSVEAVVSCTAPKGAACRMTCTAGCESWTLTGHEHTLVDQGFCNAVEWFDNCDSFLDCKVTYSAEAVRDAPIRVGWEGDFWGWEYLAQSAPSGEPS